MPQENSKKIIVVFGATGAQGLAVIDALLAAQTPAGVQKAESPYAVRALTRDLASKRAQELALKGVELFQGENAFSPLFSSRANADTVCVI